MRSANHADTAARAGSRPRFAAAALIVCRSALLAVVVAPVAWGSSPASSVSPIGQASDDQPDPTELDRLLNVSATPALERRAIAKALRESLPAEAVIDVLPALADPDTTVRQEVARLLARGDLGSRARPERVTGLIRAATSDTSSEVRLAAIEGLGDIGDRSASEALSRLVRAASRRSDQRAAAAALAAAPEGEDALKAIVVSALSGRGLVASEAVGHGVLAELLPPFSRALADADAPTDAELVPLIVALRHPSDDLRFAAAAAFDAAVSRLAESRGSQRASRFLARLAALGLERDVALYQSARLALSSEGNGAAALERANALLNLLKVAPRPSARVDSYESQLWLFRAQQLRGAAHFLLGDFASASTAFDAGSDAIERGLAERRDLLAPSERLRHVDLLQQRALAQLMRVLAAIALNEEPAEVLARARDAHAIHLESQALAAEIRGEALAGFDSLFASDLAPHGLLFAAESMGAAKGGVPRRDLIAFAGKFGRALASVAPGELPGFASMRPPGLTVEQERTLFDPLADEVRSALLARIRSARLDGLDEVIDEAEELFGRLGSRSLGLIPEEEYFRLENLQRHRRFLASEPEREEPGSRAWVRDLRIPSSAALWHAQDLNAEGRGAEARVIAERLEADIDARGISNWWYVLGHDRVIRARLLIGSSLTDDGRGEEAERVVLSAAERIEDLERELTERGAGDAELEALRGLLSTALVSLAVNANVRLKDPKKANAYYERAYALRKDEFMRALLACYRARGGRDAEARALLRTIRPGPGTWYNLACTHALLGDTDRALDLLDDELSENHATEESRKRQREWAAADPDLANLRKLPRFKKLVGLR